jgi:hypothetical protein
MDYIVLDLEWNQPRWSGETVKKPVHLVGEIVQIGAVRLDERLSVKDELRLTVKAKYYQKIHRKVAKITGLGSEDLQKGLPFPAAYKKLAEFCGKDFVFITWGPDDVPMLRDNLVLHSLDEDWLPRWFDLQVLFSHQITGSVRQFALEDAIEMLGEEPFQAHDALCDAKSTALICRHLNMEKGLEEYPYLAGDITENPIETKELSVSWRNRGEALDELSATPIACPLCEDYILPERAIPQNANKFLCTGQCDKHKFLIRFRLFRGERGRIRAVREVFEMTPVLECFYENKNERHEKQKELNREKEKRKRARRREEKELLKELKEEEVLA